MPRRNPATTTASGPNAGSIADDILASASEELNKKFGDGVSQPLSSASTLSRVDHWTSTRSIVIDKVLAGGRPMPCSLVPFGRQMEISGLPGTGKTTLCAQLAAEVQSKGGFVVVTDSEERIDHPYWRSLGVNTERILNLTARTLEEVFERQYEFIMLAAVKWPTVPILMLWDSLGGTSTDSIFDDKDAEGHTKKDSIMERAKKAMMVKAKLISSGMEVINPVVAKSKVAYVYTNTLYQAPVQYGDPWRTPGGNKKDFFATVRIRLEKEKAIKEEDEATGTVREIGHWLMVETIKNSMAPMRLTMRAAIIGGQGYSNDYTVWDMGTKLKVMVRNKSWTTWVTSQNEEVAFQGWNGFLTKVKTHPLYPDLVAQVVEAL